jgi:PAS domain S-box-containing protein
MKILLIEDNQGDADIVRCTLEDEADFPFTLKHAETLAAAFEFLAKEPVDVVLSDLSLPDTDRRVTLTRLNAEAAELPIIVLTGYDDETNAILALREGAQDYLVKGQIDSGRLARALSYAVERKQNEIEREHLIHELENALATVRKSEALFHAISDASPTGIFVTDPKGECIYSNPICNEIMGTTEEENLGGGWINSLHPEDRARVPKEWYGSRGDTGGYETELRFVRKDSSTSIWGSVKAAPIRDGASILGYVGTVADISERKRSGDALRESEKQHRDLVDHSLGLICTHDMEGRLLSVNPAAARALGYEPAELIGKHLAGLLAPSARAGFPGYVARIGTGNADSGLMRIRTKAGDERIWKYNNVRFDEPGRAPYVLGHAQDMTDQILGEEVLRHSEERFRNAFDNAPIGMALMGLDSRWLKVNPALCEILGYSEQELLATNSEALTHFEDGLVGQGALRRILAGEMASCEVEKRYRHRHGQTVWTLVSVSLVHDPRNKPLYFISQIQDITERKRLGADLATARDAALASARLKSEFLANMSHEIRTPMNGVLGMAELLLSTTMTSEQRAYTGAIKSSADALLCVINDVLDFSKIEADKLDIDHIEFSLQELLADTINIMEFQAKRKGLKLGYKIKGTPDLVSGDPGRLRQIMNNLIGNALKFTERGAVVVMVEVASVNHDNVTVHFSVNDTGMGIPPDKQSMIFEPFVQADGSTARRFGGTGLGLAITRRLVEMMGGKIWLTSCPGIGSEFHVILKLGRAQRERQEKEATPQALAEFKSHCGRSLKILLAEDNDINQMLISALLEKAGHEVVAAVSGREALAALERNSFDVILMDIQMPDITGLDATRIIRMREIESGTRIPILALTAHALKGDQQRFLQAGMDGYVSKPISPQSLLRAIDALVLDSPSETTDLPAEPENPDIEFLLSTTGGDMQLLKKVTRAILKRWPSYIADLRRAITSSDAQALSQAAHSLKGIAGHMLGAPERESIILLEAFGGQNDLSRAPGMVDNLEQRLKALTVKLEHLLDEQAAS